MVPTFALAAIVVAVLLRTRPTETTAAGLEIAPVLIAQPAVSVPASLSPVPETTPAVARRAAPVRRELKAFAAAVPVPPARFARSAPLASGAVVSSAGVTVMTPAGTRALVMHTSDPKVVVVWLY
jgi:hypothetical protein